MARSEVTPADSPDIAHEAAIFGASLRPDTAELMNAAAELVHDIASEGDPFPEERFAQFLQKYRDWILHHRNMARDRQTWVERYSILMHLMVGASTLGEAISILTRFVEPVWGSHARYQLVDEGEAMALRIDEPFERGPDGVISALWLLSCTLCQMEFLIGQKLDGVGGQLRNQRSIPDYMERLLFGRPVEYGAPALAICIPRKELNRAVTVSTAQLPAFLRDTMRLTVNTERLHSTAESVSNLLWRGATRNRRFDAGMANMASRLGLSESTLRRRLFGEGFTFSAIRADVYDRLAKMWLDDTDLTIEQIAERLGYSDGFAFRRAFRGHNGMPPQTYRRAHRNSRIS